MKVDDVVFWTVTSIVALILVGGFIVLLVHRFGRHLASVVEPPLFKRLADVHELSPAQRIALLRLAQIRGLARPESFFACPRLLEAGLSRAAQADPKTSRALHGIRERLFGKAAR